jgi:5'-hydroxyaverantin dehydrogenase
MSKIVQREPVDWAALKDRTVIITGGASGLGEATVEKFAEHGAFVTIADVDGERGGSLAERLTAEGKHVLFAKCDTTNWDSSAAAFKKAVNFGPSKTLDCAILYAGVSGPCVSLVDAVLETEEPTLANDPIPQPRPVAIEVNLIGVWLCTWLALHYFRLPTRDGSDRKKSLTIVSSLAGYVCVPESGLWLRTDLSGSLTSHTHQCIQRPNMVFGVCSEPFARKCTRSTPGSIILHLGTS